MRFSRSGLMPSTVALATAFSHTDILIEAETRRALRVLAYLDFRAMRRA